MRFLTSIGSIRIFCLNYTCGTAGCISAEGIGREISEYTVDQTTAVAEVDGIVERTSSKLSSENGSMELSESGTTLADENPWHEEQHYTQVPSSDISLKQEPVPRQFRIYQMDNRESWVWNPLYESRVAYRQEVQVGFLDRFELVNHYSPSHLSPDNLHKQSAEEFIVAPGGNVLSVSEDEISSIISRALAVSEERRRLLDAIIESEAADIRGRSERHTKTMDKSYSSVSETSSASSVGSSDSEAGFSSSEDLSSYDSSLLPSSLHPEISVNGKGTCSVLCVHSDQFYTLRKKCCPSELAYITSLSIKDIAPLLYAVVSKRNAKRRTVAQALNEHSWLSDARGASSLGVVWQFLQLRNIITEFTLQPGIEDTHIWRLSSSGQYSTKSAYENLFQGATQFRPYDWIWQSWAPGKCKFFLWLVAHDRCWTADRLAHRWLPHPERCPLCDQDQESINHLLVACSFARQYWFTILSQVGLQALAPQPTDDVFDNWWEKAWRSAPDQQKKGLNSLVELGAWTIWNH